MSKAAWTSQPDPVAYRKAIATEVRVLMTRRRVTQQTLAEALGKTQGTLSKKLSGLVAWDTDTLVRIAAYFDVPITDLMPINSCITQTPAGRIPGEQELPFQTAEPVVIDLRDTHQLALI